MNPIDEAMSLPAKDKASLLAGRDFWSTRDIDDIIPSMTMTDGPTGLRKQVGSFDNLGISESVPATCFPCECATGSSFDEEILELVGRALGEECQENEVDIVLGPGITTKRHPLGGRNFEYFSEEPLVSGKLGAAMVKGIQSTGTGACVKHFAANSQETGRMTSDSIIDEHTLHSVYLKAFETVVREAHPEAVMTAYNKVNGEYCSQNEELLSILRDWGFDGIALTDWGALSKSVQSVLAGLDLVMPGPRPDHIDAVVKAHADGDIGDDVLNERFATVADCACKHASERKPGYESDHAEHLAIAQLASEAGSVLLKNDGVLPLNEGVKVAVIGEFAKVPRYQGAGSSKVNPISLDNALEAFEDMGVDFTYSKAYDAETGFTSEELIADAVTAAKESDVAVVFAGLPASYESEGFDRATMEMPSGMNELIREVAEANGSMVVVLAGGAPMELPWADSASAILMTYLPGCRGGHATANLLFGKANPCGRLAETWPARIEDTALGRSFPVSDKQVFYVEGPYVGYRFYDAADVEPAYPFGFGLSYTDFKYTKLTVSHDEDGIRASLKVKNTGSVEGAEVVQIYVGRSDDALPLPKKQLAGFTKVHLAPKESIQIDIPLSLDAFSYWNVEKGEFELIAGKHDVMAASSSRDIRQTKGLSLRKSTSIGGRAIVDPPELDRDKLSQYFDVSPDGFTKRGFAALYGKPLPVPVPTRPFSPDSRLSDLKTTMFGRVLVSMIYTFGDMEFNGNSDMRNMLEAMFDFMPLRFLMMGGVSAKTVNALVSMLNRLP